MPLATYNLLDRISFPDTVEIFSKKQSFFLLLFNIDNDRGFLDCFWWVQEDIWDRLND